MARIPEDEIERIKREVSIVQLVEARGVKLGGHGDNLIGLCPLHDDKNPSLVVSPAKNVWHCLGACQTGGSVIDWLMKADGASFRLAVEMLRKKASSLGAKVPGTRAKLDELAEPHDPDRVVLRRVVDFYHLTLKQSPEALAYLEYRGLRSSEMIDVFRLGYSNRTLAYRLPTKQIKTGEAIRTQLQRLGVLRGSGHEHLVGSLVIPIFGEEGEVLELYGRKIRSNLRQGTPDHLYLPRRADGRRGVFNAAALKASKDIILCEALIDALTFFCAGHRNVTSAYGVEGFTEELRDAFLENNIERVLIAYDRDEAGDRAAEKLARELGSEGIAVYRVLFPKGMDANEYAAKVQPASKSLGTAVEGARWMAGARGVSVPDALTKQEAPSRIEPPRTAEPEVVLRPSVPDSESSIALETEKQEARPIASRDEPQSPACAAPSDLPLPERPILVAVSAVETSASCFSTSSAAPSLEPSASSSTAPTEHPPPPSEVAPPLAAKVDEAPPAPSPTSSVASLEAEATEDEVRVRLGDRRWRIRGLAKNTTPGALRLNVLVARGDAFFVDTVELYSARQRTLFLKQAVAELGVDEAVIKSDLGKLIIHLEGLVEQRSAVSSKGSASMTEEQRSEALALLRDPRLLARILEDFDRAGVVGEESNKLIGYLAAISRKLEAPLAVVIQSSSAAGKSSLMDAVLRFMPEEERVQYSAMTGQSLFYMGETDLAHKILAIAEEQGAHSAAYALKLLQSEGELTIASTGKDPNTGKLITHKYRVKGPVMIFLTTTAIEVDEELLNRCLILTVDEGAEQTSAIHERQRASQTLEGLLERHDRERVIALHQNAQRLLEPLLVANPFAKELRFASRATRARRDHMKYLTLIRSIALLHQHQREVKRVTHRGQALRYIEVARADIDMADRLAASVLGHDADEMPPQTRRLLELVDAMVSAEAKKQGIEKSAVRFTRKDVRSYTRWSDSALKKHLGRLEDLEHLLLHGGGARRRTIYELATYEYGDHWSPPKGNWSPLGHPLVTPGGRPVSLEDSREKRDLDTLFAEAQIPGPRSASSKTKPNGASYGV